MSILKNYLMRVLLVTALIALQGTLFAEDILNANDLASESLSSPKKIDKFTIMANSEKVVTIDVLENSVSAKDGEIFNNRINLKGGGNADYRSIKFTAKKGAEIIVYLASSSKTDARIMKLCNANGETVAEFTGAPYTDANASMGTVKIPANGEYYLISVNSGMYIYQIIIK